MKLVVPLVLFSAQDLQAFSGPKGKFPGKWHGVKLSPWKRHQLMKLRASKFGRRPMGFNRPHQPKPSNYKWTPWQANQHICRNGELKITRSCQNTITKHIDNTKCPGISERSERCSIENMNNFSMNNFVHLQQEDPSDSSSNSKPKHNQTDYLYFEGDFDDQKHVDFENSESMNKNVKLNLNSRKRRQISLNQQSDGRYNYHQENEYGYVSMNGMSYAEPLGNRHSFQEDIDDDTYRHDNPDALDIQPGSENACCEALFTCGDAATFWKSGRYNFLGLNKENKAIYTKNNKHYISAMQGSWQLTGDITKNTITSFLYNSNYGSNSCPSDIGQDWKNWNNDDQHYFTSGCSQDVSKHVFTCGKTFESPIFYDSFQDDIFRADELLPDMGLNDGTFSEDRFEAVPHSYPWQVSVRAGAHFCGGALIRPDWIITAAHCAYYFKNWGFSVMVGEHNVLSRSEPFQEQACIDKIYLHPKYDKANPDKGNDIAIVKLAWPVKLNAHVMPICMAGPDFEVQDSDYCVTTGWGKTDPMTALGSGNLQQARVNIIPNSQCAYGSDSILCAGDNYDGACKGDSGGPLQCYRPSEEKWYLVGLTSFSLGNNADVKCAAFGYPSMFTKVSNFYSWIIGGMEWHGEENAAFSEWSAWSECSANCGNSGVMSRTRSCEGSGSCIGDTYEEAECNRVACMDQCNIGDMPFHDEMVNWHHKTVCAQAKRDGTDLVPEGKACAVVCVTGDNEGGFEPVYKGSTTIRKLRCTCTDAGCSWVPLQRPGLSNPPLQCIASARCAHPAVAFERLKDPELRFVNSNGDIVDPAVTKTIAADQKIYLKCPGPNGNDVVDPTVTNIQTEFTCTSIKADDRNIMLFLPFPQQTMVASQICPSFD